MINNKTLLTAISAALLTTTAHSETENPFSNKSLDQGYMLVAAAKTGEGKCGEGKCGATEEKAREGKCGEGKCGAEGEKTREGKCGGEHKTPEAKCGADKASEGKCGAKG